MMPHALLALPVLAAALPAAHVIAGDTDAGSTVIYQGRLSLDGEIVDEACDFRFTLWSMEEGSEGQIGDLLTAFNVPVNDGVFAVDLDFGDDAFTGKARWLEISVRLNDVGGAYSTLAPRQPLYAAPYSLWAINSPFSVLKGDGDSVTLAGNLGIGTLIPMLPLDVVGSARVQEAADGSGGSVIIDGSGAIALSDATSTTVELDADSGTVTAESLVATSGGVEFPDATVQTTAALFYSAGSGLTLTGTTFSIPPNAIGSTEVIDDSLTDDDLGPGSVGSSEVMDNSLTANDLGPNSVGASEIAAGAVGTSEVANNSLTDDDLGPGSVGSSEVIDNSLGAIDLGPNSVGASEIATNAVGASEIASNSVGSADLASDAGSLSKVTGTTLQLGGAFGGIEYFAGTPFIDFHFGNSGADFTYRIINSAEQQLQFWNQGGMRVSFNQGGRVGIGTDDPNTLLEVNGGACKPGGGSWGTCSDRRLKKNIEPLHGALDWILDLRGATFEWREPAAHGDQIGTQIGFIAQDVEPVMPDWITETTDGYLMVNVRGFEALTVEALRELREEKDAEIAARDARIDELETLLIQLAARVGQLETAAGADN